MLSGVTIAGLLSTLMALGIFVIKLFLITAIWAVISWIILTFIFVRRAYFYKYLADTWYDELFQKILFVIKLGRNKAWFLRSETIGYISRPLFRKKEKTADDIFSVAFFRGEQMGQVQFVQDSDGNRKGEVVLKYVDVEGNEHNNNQALGYIDINGNIYKYFENRKALEENRRLEPPVFIGRCENPRVDKIQDISTEGEEDDDIVALKYIKPKNVEINQQQQELGIKDMPKTWWSFRKNKASDKKVRCLIMKSDGAAKDGRPRWIDVRMWRTLRVFPAIWDYTHKAWGYGFCKENSRWLNFRKNDQEINLLQRAAAALMLLEEQGFANYDDERKREDTVGLAATALLSLFVYLISARFLWNIISHYKLFPFLGTYISNTVCFFLIFVFIWLFIHFFRKIALSFTPSFENFLTLLNVNKGVLSLTGAIIVLSVIGLITSYFITSYALFAVFLAIATAFSFNWSAYRSPDWDIDKAKIEDKKKSDGLKKEEYEDEDFNEKSKNRELIERKFYCSVESLYSYRPLTFSLFFTPKKIEELRIQNCFRTEWGNHNKYTELVDKLLKIEFAITENPSVYQVAKKLNRFADDHCMPIAARIQLFLSFCQPDNVVYHHDWLSEELNLPEGIDEYCRFPSETMFDQRGDCDCHAALAASVLVAGGFKVCFICGMTEGDIAHASIGIASGKGLDLFLHSNNSFTGPDGEKYIYCEPTGKSWNIGVVPPGFEGMINPYDMMVVQPISA